MIHPTSENESASSARRRAAHLLWVSNILLGSVVGLPLLKHAPFGGVLRAWIFGALGLVSTIAILTLLPGLLSLVLASAVPQRWLRSILLAILWSLFQLLLYADVQIYEHFRYHLSGSVWNVMTTAGADDSVSLASSDYVWIVGGWSVLFVLEGLLHSGLAKADVRRRERQRDPRVWTRARRIWWAFLVPIIVVEKSCFAFADLVRDRRVTVIARALPFYQPLTVKKFAEEHLGYELTDRPAVDVGVGGLLLDYPKIEPKLAQVPRPPNILMVVLDCWRADCLTPEITPGLFSLAENARVFQDHTAGGNATRFGVFTLLYGLHGSYWEPVYQEKRPPVLVTTLIDAGYQMSVYAGASMNYPEFRSTAWVQFEEHVHDTFEPEEPWQKDNCAVEGFIEMLETRHATGDKRPFFTFMMFDGSHAPFSFPEEEAVFKPYTKSISYVDLSGAERTQKKKTRRWNAYRNSLVKEDRQLERIWNTLRATGEFENTIILVTGDHGEEFLDHGFFGHTSNFAPAQVRVPLILRGPGVEPGVEESPTSHVDVPTTLLELLGADGSQRQGWSLGVSLFEPLPERGRVMSGWMTLGLWTKSGIFYLPTNAALGGAELYDYDWKLVLDDERAFTQEASELARVMRESRRFLR